VSTNNLKTPIDYSLSTSFAASSRDNDAAAAVFDLMRIAEIARAWTSFWNVIPWWNGTREVSGLELRAGVVCAEGSQAVTSTGTTTTPRRPFA